MTVTAFIPARGGSTRIPRKNLQEVGELSLLHRAIDTAFVSGADEVVVSTDDDEIAEHASSEYVVTIHQRPSRGEELPPYLDGAPRTGPIDRNDAKTEWWIAHWLHRAYPPLEDTDVILIAQCTSPFTRPETIRECIRMVQEEGCDSALSVYMDVKRAAFSGRVRAIYDEQKQRDVGLKVIWDRPYNYRPRTQDIRPVPVETGGVYAFTAKHFRATRCRMGGREAVVPVDEIEAIDVDTPRDLELARLIAPHVERLRSL